MSASEHINEYFNGKSFMLLCAMALVAVTAVSLSLGVEPSSIQGEGLFFPLRGTLIDRGPVSAAINLLCLLATGGIMLALNKVFTFVRSMTRLFVSVGSRVLQCRHIVVPDHCGDPDAAVCIVPG